MADDACSESSYHLNSYRAAKERPGVFYARIWVDVTNVASDIVTILVPTKNDQGHKEIKIRWGLDNHDVWVECPTTLASGKPGNSSSTHPAPPPPNSSGYLYISETLCIQEDLIGDPKWPTRLPEEVFYKVRIWPRSLIVDAIEVSTNKRGTINLADPLLTRTGTPLVFRGGSIDVELTQKGHSTLKAPNNIDDSSKAAATSRSVEALPDLAGLCKAIEVINEHQDGSVQPSPHELAAAWSTVATWDTAEDKCPEAKLLLDSIWRREERDGEST